MDLEHFNFSELRDVEIVTRMRKCNYEKFKTLVRMHLSFELDLNTDEFDLPCHEIVYEDKGKLRKWNRLSKKHKHGAVVAALASGSTGCALGGGNSNGSSYCTSAGISPPDNLHQTIDQGFLFHLQELKEFLMLNKNIQQEGIFRKTGSASRQNDLRMQIQNDKPLDLEASGYSAHDCATVFKGYLSELPEPLLTDAHYPAHLQIAPLCLAVNAQLDTNTTNEQKTYSISSTSSLSGERLKRELHVLNSIQLLLLLLPDENRQLLQHVIEMLHAVALQQQHNKMGSDNLATLFAPHLICPRNLPPEALHYLARKMSSIISYMIVRGQDIFAVPAKLATDIRAYFLERKRKKTMSPEMALDESISDISTVNTVYTFVDREKTAAVTTTNNTDTELAQLYAHIQSMPESSKKRRLIKQFNKQNGQGTPLQLQAMNRLKTTDANRGAKSLSDSIKKHIFHKGIMSRTPKRQPAAGIVLETPNNCSMKQHKQRVLFQSPNPQINNSCSTDIATNSSSSLSSASTSTSTSTSASSLTPYNIKTHPLQKSISSSSLQMTHNSHKQQQDQISKSQLNKILHKQELVIKPISSLSHASNHSNNSSDGFVCNIKSVSAPVSRQTSSDLAIQPINNNNSSCTFQTLDSNCCVTPLKLISDAAKHLIIGSGAADKKSVAWNDSHTIDNYSMDNHTNDISGNCPLTPLHEMQQHTPANDLKSRYKSEPNLSLCHHDVCETPSSHSITPITTKLMPSKSITRKLMKGVSMGNLRFPFTTPDTRKRLVRTVSSSLKRRGSDDLHIYQQAEGSFAAAIKTGHAPLLQDMDEDDDDDENESNVDTNEDANLNDETFEDEGLHEVGTINVALECTIDEEIENHDVVYNVIEPYVGSGSSSSELNNFTGGSASYQQLLLQQSGIYRNLDLVTSTPSLLLGRRSMSPITKSTQRMPKAMQESIMTPRSRKPVMVLTTTVSSADHNQTINPNDLGQFQENDENDLDNDDTDVENELEEDVLDKTKSHDTLPQTEVINEDATSLGGYSDIFKRRQLLHANQSFVQQNKQTSIDSNSNSNNAQRKDERKLNEEKINENQNAANELSKHFKEYLLSRSVLTAAAPVDTSFSSHSDDYESSHEMDDIDENQLSSSLLYCLDGNRPESESINNSNSYDDDDNDADDETTTATNAKKFQLTTTAVSSTNLNSTTKDYHKSSMSTLPRNRLANNPFVILNNARKRAAANDLEKISSLLFNSQNSPNCHSEFQRYATNLLRTQQLNKNEKYLSPAASSSISCSSSAAAVLGLENKENYQHNNEIYVANKKLMRDRQLGALGQAEDEDEDFPGETSF